jgi:nitroreductase
MDALTAISQRHSTRSFSDQPVAREVLEKIVDAARMAPTARNEQPWEFLVVTDPEKRKSIGAIAQNGAYIADAGACLAIFCRDSKYYLEDGCLAAGNALIAATALGLQSCWVAGDKKPYGDEIGQLLGVPVGYKLVAMLALGHGRDDGRRETKRPLEEVLHWERW